MKIRTALLSIALMFSSPWGHATTYSYPNMEQPLFSIDIPDRWRVEVDEEVLHTTPPDESVYLGFVALDANLSGDDVGNAVDELINGMVRNPSVDGEKEIVVNDIPLSYFQGSGLDEEGGAMKYGVAMFSPNGEIVCIVFYFGTPESEARHEGELIKIIESIRRGGAEMAPVSRKQTVSVGYGWEVELPAEAERTAPPPARKFVMRDLDALIGLEYKATEAACGEYLEATRRQTLKGLENPAQRQLMRLSLFMVDVDGRQALVSEGGVRTPAEAKSGSPMHPISILTLCVAEHATITTTLSRRQGELSDRHRDLLREVAASARPSR